MPTRASLGTSLVASTMLVLLAACHSAPPGPTPSAPPLTRGSGSGTTPAAATPQLLGLGRAQAGRRIGRLESATHLGLSSDWRSEVITHCGPRPGTVVRQRPAPGTPLHRGSVIHVRVAAMDLRRFRGPCAVPGSVTAPPRHRPDAALAERFYRFAVDPHQPGPFAPGPVWTGLEDGPGRASTLVQPRQRRSPRAWRVRATYAERRGPFSALDVVARSGGYLRVHPGIAPTCPAGNAAAPRSLRGFRAITLTPWRDAVDSCSAWWGVTLFLDDRSQIRGVALRVGAP